MSEHAQMRQELTRRDQTAKDNALLAVQRGEEIERLKTRLKKVYARLDENNETMRSLGMERDELREELRKLREASGNVTMTVDNLRRLAKQAYDQGQKAASDKPLSGVESFLKDFGIGRQ